jgi:hypothetical protein
MVVLATGPGLFRPKDRILSDNASMILTQAGLWGLTWPDMVSDLMRSFVYGHCSCYTY